MAGNDVRMGDIIAANNVTMINYWGTTCASCVDEMPSLEGVSQKYADQGFTIIGLCADVLDSDGTIVEKEHGDAEKIIADTGVTYPIVLATSELNQFVDSSFTPATYFVDKDGNLIGKAVVGSQSEEKWDQIINERISGLK